MRIDVLDHGYVLLRNISGPTRRVDQNFDAHDVDPANSARFSFDAADKEDRLEEADIKLARYLYKNKHTTPFEMIEIWLEMKMPIFVARQLVRHRTVSINEVSARYVKLSNEFYIPSLSVVGIKSSNNKQGRDISKNLSYNERRPIVKFVASLIKRCADNYKAYETAMEDGIPNELARMMLPLNIYTKWLWKQDLHNMLHFLRLRMHDHAQYEIRQYANAIHQMLTEVLPESMKIFDETR